MEMVSIMKRSIIKILSTCLQAISTLLYQLRLIRPKIIVYMDGGICSQMMMYIQGQYYAESGFDVRYDIHWFEVCGKDQFGIMPRTFEFTEMWPNLEFKTISKWQRKFYLLFFSAKRINEDWLPEPSTITHSIYFGGYWDLSEGEYNRLFAKCFDITKTSIPIRGGREFNNFVGVHVRRGDLAKGDNPIYGGVSDGYFLRAIEFCNKKFAPKKYMFFSDEPDWVEQNICPYLTQSYEIMRGNKAWEDLWLLAHCSVIVASQGSFGKVATQLNPNATLIQCDNEHAKRDRKNTYIVK